MSSTVFFSWQSDLPETRSVIQGALRKAIASLNRDLTIEETPLRLDQDTDGVAGWPEITSAILDKIAACDVFVADITPINLTQDGYRLTPNPNVLFELGYAIAIGMGRDRVICIVNTAYLPDGDIKHLPFDIRSSRPIRFALDSASARGVEKGQEDQERIEARAEMAKSLERTLQQTLAAVRERHQDSILTVTPHLATENLESFQAVFDVATDVPFQMIYSIKEPAPLNKILSAIMMSPQPIDPKGRRRIRMRAESLKPLTPGNDTYVLYGEIGHVATDSNPVPEMHSFEVHYRATNGTLMEIHRQQPPAH